MQLRCFKEGETSVMKGLVLLPFGKRPILSNQTHTYILSLFPSLCHRVSVSFLLSRTHSPHTEYGKQHTHIKSMTAVQRLNMW